MMRLHVLPLALSLAMLAACSGEAPPTGGKVPAPDLVADESPGSARASLPEQGELSGPSHAPPSPGEDAQPSFGGYGDIEFGTAAAAMESAWGGELMEIGKEFNASCYFMTPTWLKTPAEFNFMISEGRFVRFGTESPNYVAPGGGKIGMTRDEIGALYAGRIEEQPHHYRDGQYLRIRDAAGGNGVLIFETDARTDAARVTEWRVGLPPEVDYVEGCS